MCIKIFKKKSIKYIWANTKDSIFMRIKPLKRRITLRLVFFAIFVSIKTSTMKKEAFEIFVSIKNI